VKIFASNSLDEYAIEALIRTGAPIDGFGVGGRMGTSEDAPFLDTAYKLVEYDGRPRMKLSHDKSTLPGRKQVFREKSGGRMQRDVLALADEKMPLKPLLIKVMENGRRTAPPETLDAMRVRCLSELAALPGNLKSLSPAQPPYPVQVSEQLTRMRADFVGHVKL
jgi:nicotinate phosphoribosyltransferase